MTQPINEAWTRQIAGLESLLENAKIRDDAYDVGYISAMLKEARAALAHAASGKPDSSVPTSECKSAELPQPAYWMTSESMGRIKNGGNIKGAVPVHAKRSATAIHPLFTAAQMQAVLSGISSLPNRPNEQNAAGRLPEEPPADLISAMAIAHEQSTCHDLEGPMTDAYSALVAYFAAAPQTGESQ